METLAIQISSPNMSKHKVRNLIYHFVLFFILLVVQWDLACAELEFSSTADDVEFIVAGLSYSDVDFRVTESKISSNGVRISEGQLKVLEAQKKAKYDKWSRKQAFILGKEMRRRYGELFGDEFNTKEISLITSGDQISELLASWTAHGIYSVQSFDEVEWAQNYSNIREIAQNVRVEKEILKSFDRGCENRQALEIMKNGEIEFVQNWMKSEKSLIEYVMRKVNATGPATLQALSEIARSLEVSKHLNLGIPRWIKNLNVDTDLFLKRIQQFDQGPGKICAKVKICRSAIAGHWLKVIFDAFSKLAKTGKKTNKKAILFVAPHETVQAVMRLANYEGVKTLENTAGFIMEFRRTAYPEIRLLEHGPNMKNSEAALISLAKQNPKCTGFGTFTTWCPYEEVNRRLGPGFVVKRSKCFKPSLKMSEAKEAEPLQEPIQLLGLAQSAATNTSITVTWDTKAGDNKRITKYLISVSPASDPRKQESFLIPPALDQYSIVDLKPESRYLIEVTVYATDGTTASLSAWMSTIETAIPIKVLRKLGSTQTSLLVQWTIDDIHRKNVVRFQASIKKEGDIFDKTLASFNVSKKQNEKFFNELRPGTSYEVIVQAFSKNLPGEPTRGVFRTNEPEAVVITSLEKVGISTDALFVAWAVKDRDRQSVSQFKVSITDVEENTSGRTFTVGRDSSSYYFFGLDPGITYEVKITPVTKDGDGVPKVKQFRTESKQVEIRELEILQKKPTSILVGWTLVSNADARRIRNFKLTIAPVENPRKVRTIKLGRKKVFSHVKRLIPETLYNITLTAVSELGPSLPFTVLAFTGTDQTRRINSDEHELDEFFEEEVETPIFTKAPRRFRTSRPLRKTRPTVPPVDEFPNLPDFKINRKGSINIASENTNPAVPGHRTVFPESNRPSSPRRARVRPKFSTTRRPHHGFDRQETRKRFNRLTTPRATTTEITTVTTTTESTTTTSTTTTTTSTTTTTHEFQNENFLGRIIRFLPSDDDGFFGVAFGGSTRAPKPIETRVPITAKPTTTAPWTRVTFAKLTRPPRTTRLTTTKRPTTKRTRRTFKPFTGPTIRLSRTTTIKPSTRNEFFQLFTRRPPPETRTRTKTTPQSPRSQPRRSLTTKKKQASARTKSPFLGSRRPVAGRKPRINSVKPITRKRVIASSNVRPIKPTSRPEDIVQNTLRTEKRTLKPNDASLSSKSSLRKSPNKAATTQKPLKTHKNSSPQSTTTKVHLERTRRPFIRPWGRRRGSTLNNSKSKNSIRKPKLGQFSGIRRTKSSTTEAPDTTKATPKSLETGVRESKDASSDGANKRGTESPEKPVKDVKFKHDFKIPFQNVTPEPHVAGKIGNPSKQKNRGTESIFSRISKKVADRTGNRFSRPEARQKLKNFIEGKAKLITVGSENNQTLVVSSNSRLANAISHLIDDEMRETKRSKTILENKGSAPISQGSSTKTISRASRKSTIAPIIISVTPVPKTSSDALESTTLSTTRVPPTPTSTSIPAPTESTTTVLSTAPSSSRRISFTSQSTQQTATTNAPDASSETSPLISAVQPGTQPQKLSTVKIASKHITDKADGTKKTIPQTSTILPASTRTTLRESMSTVVKKRTLQIKLKTGTTLSSAATLPSVPTTKEETSTVTSITTHLAAEHSASSTSEPSSKRGGNQEQSMTQVGTEPITPPSPIIKQRGKPDLESEKEVQSNVTSSLINSASLKKKIVIQNVVRKGNIEIEDIEDSIPRTDGNDKSAMKDLKNPNISQTEKSNNMASPSKLDEDIISEEEGSGENENILEDLNLMESKSNSPSIASQNKISRNSNHLTIKKSSITRPPNAPSNSTASVSNISVSKKTIDTENEESSLLKTTRQPIAEPRKGIFGILSRLIGGSSSENTVTDARSTTPSPVKLKKTTQKIRIKASTRRTMSSKASRKLIRNRKPSQKLSRRSKTTKIIPKNSRSLKLGKSRRIAETRGSTHPQGSFRNHNRSRSHSAAGVIPQLSNSDKVSGIPKSRVRLVKPETQLSCKDSDPRCPLWANAGYCVRGAESVVTICQRSCNCCGCSAISSTQGRNTQNGCHDADSNCYYWATAGYCTADFNVRTNLCRASCRTCTNS